MYVDNRDFYKLDEIGKIGIRATKSFKKYIAGVLIWDYHPTIL